MKNDKLKISKKGFTLVEVIVVIVIIAILAAIAIPALTGYINKAKDKNYIAESRQAVTASQIVANESYAAGKKITADFVSSSEFVGEVMKLGEIPTGGKIEYSIFSDAVLTELLYSRDGVFVLYKDGKYTIVDGGGSGGVTPTKPDDSMTSFSVFDPATGQYVSVNAVGNIIGQRTSAVKGKIVWFPGNDTYEAGYYYINAWQNFLLDEANFNDSIEQITNYGKNPTTFRKIDTDAPARLYDGPAESNFPTNPEKNANVFRGHFYYVNFEWDNDPNPVLAVFIGATDAWGYRGDLSLTANKDLWKLASDF